MKNKFLIFFLLYFLLYSTQLEARKGRISLFNIGSGARVVKGIKNYDMNTLSVEQLKACLIREQKIDSSEQELHIKKKPLDEKEIALNRLERDITSLESYLNINGIRNFRTQQQVDEFNSKVDRYNESIEEYNVEVNSYKSLEVQYNKFVGEHNDLITVFDLSCAGKSYYEEDLIAVKAMLPASN